MAIKEALNKTDKKLDKVEECLEELNQKSIAMEVLKFSKDQTKQSNDNLLLTNKRLCGLLIFSLFINLLFGIGIFYYITNYTEQVTTEEVENNDGGNACIGDSCNNGEINYGKGEKKDN